MAAIKPWLQLLRLSNLPTVWSNVLAGYVIGLWVIVEAHHDVMMGDDLSAALRALRESWALLLGFSLIYLGGMAMNDVVDAPLDARQRSARPIPAGRISRGAAAFVMVLLLASGLGALEAHRRWQSMDSDPWVLVGGGLLVAAVIAYNLLHQYSAWAMGLMAACRGLVSLTAATAVYWPFDSRAGGAAVALALAIAAYTLMISTVARGEDQPHAGPNRKHVVMGLIAAMPVVDASAMLAIEQWGAALACAACAPLAFAGQRFVSGT